MKLTIKLKDPEYCDGCPCLSYYHNLHLDWITNCGLRYELNNMSPHFFRLEKCGRPQKCIKDNGL